ncbi:MAG: hypothetical protein Q7U38_02315, partial [Methylobacter sp.]|nr:hypothetical protein [Methylobacter sp.]
PQSNAKVGAESRKVTSRKLCETLRRTLRNSAVKNHDQKSIAHQAYPFHLSPALKGTDHA